MTESEAPESIRMDPSQLATWPANSIVSRSVTACAAHIYAVAADGLVPGPA